MCDFPASGKECLRLSTYSDYSERPAGPADDRLDAQRPAATRSNSPKRRRRRRRHPILAFFGFLFKLLGTLLLIGIVTGCFVACYGAIYIQTVIMPEADRLDLSSFTLNEPSTIYYTDKNTGQSVAYATLVGTEDRIILETDEIPQVFKDVAVSVEDKRFYKHKGVDWIRTAGAVLYMFTGRDIQGGSTITQQVIKNYTQEDEVTVKRKILEIFRALSVESKYNKDDILTLYLNKINLGGKVCGIGAAARYYFDKDVSEITLPEAASIIAITNNPSLFSPYSTVETINSNGEVETGLERNKRRQELILWLMCYEEDIALISEEEYEAAINAPLNFSRGQTQAELAAGQINSWYTDEVIGEVVDYFVSQGYTNDAAYDLIYNAGLHIYTPFDPDVQAKVDEVYTNLENLPYISRDGQQMQSCITIVDNANGYVVAMAGAMGEKTGNLWWNYATDSTRQPGSSIKPLAVYSPAIDMGLITPYSIVDDAPYQMLNGNPWPVNADGYYSGLATVQDAVSRSTNTAAVKVLNDILTPQLSFQFMEEKYGITTLEDYLLMSNGEIKDDFGPSSLSLGGLTHGLSPYEVTAAYATFPRGGVFTAATVVHRVENRDHQVIWDNTPENTYPIKQSTAYYMNQMLQRVISGGVGATGTAAQIPGMHVAGKTGTTSEKYDLWFAGYTPYYTAAVWTGYPRNATIDIYPSPAAILWKQVMVRLHEGLEDRDFPTVSNLNTYNICLDCGQRATEACNLDLRGSRVGTFTFVEGTQPSGYCTCHTSVTVCTGGLVYNEDGTAAQAGYYLPCDLCPAETRVTMTLVDHDRTGNEACMRVSIADQQYMLSNYEQLQVCPVHSILDPSWQDPNAWPSDPGSNWWDPDQPGYTAPPVTSDPVTSDPPVTSEPPTSEPPYSEPPVTSDPVYSDPPYSEPPVQESPPGDAYVPVW